MSFTSARLGCFRLGMVPPSSACGDVHAKPAHPMTNRTNCPGLSEMPVRDFLKSLSATYRNRCPGLSETRILAILQLLSLGDEAVGLDGIDEIGRRL